MSLKTTTLDFLAEIQLPVLNGDKPALLTRPHKATLHSSHLDYYYVDNSHNNYKEDEEIFKTIYLCAVLKDNMYREQKKRRPS